MNTFAPHAAFALPAYRAALDHRVKCEATAKAIRHELACIDIDIAHIGHPDKWRRDTVQMADMIERQVKLFEAHIKAMTDFMLSCEGREETPDVYFFEDLTDALHDARKRAEARDA